ncbi:uncharacterized protein LOC120506113 [Passer montanus]|uniref:uncharacterized protein LOC120506113 n=1 Tax=Passer montanus TaxID=9160 RepID=UPI00195FDE81|nr:uncharacterized protein LOC120506113 [Passer montanus]
MWLPEPQAGSGSPDCPDLLQHVQALHLPSTPLYLSFFEEECRAIAERLHLAAAAEPSPGQGELSGLQPITPGPATSTPLPLPSHGRVPDSSAGDCEAAAAPARGGRWPRPGRGRARLALPRARASLGLQPPAAGAGRGNWETRLLRPPGARLKLTSPARSRLQRASGVSQRAQPSHLPKLAPRGGGMKSNAAPASSVARSRETPAAKVGSCKQSSSRPSTEIPTVASRSSLRPLEKVTLSKHFCLNKVSTTEDLVCNRTRELKENDERKERLVAASIVLGAGRNDQTWECVESSLSSELAPVLTSRCEDAVPAEQSAGDQLSQELERVKKELEQVKGELADKTAQCKAYQQTISSLQAQLRAAGICLKDAAVFDSGELGKD